MFLTEAGKGIEKLKLSHNLDIQSISEEKAAKLYSTLEGVDLESARTILFLEASILNANNNKAYYITRFFEGDGISYINSFGKIQREIVFEYLHKVITKLRLFKEGNIGYWRYYFYDEKTKGSQVNTIDSKFSTRFGIKYELSSQIEINQCNNLLNKIKLPDEGQIKIAIDNFNQSYNSTDIEITFLNLMISLEALFSKQDTELFFRLTRNCAIFLGKTKLECNELYKNIRELYKIRSLLIHGKKYKLENNHVYLLRDYIRKSILNFLKIKKSHDVLLEELDTLGFGQYSKINM